VVGEAALGRRAAQVIGAQFLENAMRVDAERDGVQISGYAGLPTFNRANSLQQFTYVNGRPLRDPLVTGALRAAYADVLARDRYPVAALFIALSPGEVDVNVHPAKLEVRFRDPGLVRGLIIGAIREALAAQAFALPRRAGPRRLLRFDRSRFGPGTGSGAGAAGRRPTMQASARRRRRGWGCSTGPQAMRAPPRGRPTKRS
jgi:DNA mismatch repair protein MutL